MQKVLQVTLLTLCALLSKAQVLEVGGNTFDISYISDSDQIEMTSTVPLNSWFSVGFGTSMFDADYYIFYAGSTADDSSVDDAHYGGSGRSVVSDDIQNVEVVGITAEGADSLKFVVRRDREIVNDDSDADIELGAETSMIYAFMSQESLGSHGSSNRGVFTITFNEDGTLEQTVNADGTVTTAEVVELEDHTGFFIAKGWAMWFTWGLLGFVILAAHRYYHHYWKVAFKIHALGSWVITILTIYFSIFAFYKYDWKFGEEPHSKIGLGFAIVAVLTHFQGILSMMKRSKFPMQWKQDESLKIKRIHAKFGYVFLILNQILIFTGIHSLWKIYGVGSNGLGILHVVLWLIVMGIHECRRNSILSQEDAWKYPEGKEMDREEFEQRVMKGEQLMILDDLVLDVKEFDEFHPGGRWLIEHNIGRDISKFFYGGYKLDNKVDTKGWAHTNFARKMVNSMIIAKLTKNGEKAAVQNLVSDASKAKLNRQTSVFTYKSEVKKPLKQIQKFYQDVSMIGKHYIFNLSNNQMNHQVEGYGVKRHYTITNCLPSNVHLEYIRAMKEVIDGKDASSVSFDQSVLSTEPSDEINVTIKNYNLKGGLSPVLHNDVDQQAKMQWDVQGPLGKGLGVSADSKGTHLAFSAGTGSLTFIDLVAHMILLALGQSVDGLTKLDPTFKLVYYLSFQTREDSMCLELCETFQALQKKLGLDNFELVVRISKEGKPRRWDQKFIEEEIVKHAKESKHQVDGVQCGGIGKIWVCGPPVMSQGFDMAFDELKKPLGLTMAQIDVL